MVAGVAQFTSFTRVSHGIATPTEQDCCLPYIERARAVLEHLWNTNAVDRWGPLVIRRLFRCYAA